METQHRIFIKGDLHHKGIRRKVSQKATELNVKGRVGYSNDGIFIIAEANDFVMPQFLTFCYSINNERIEIEKCKAENYSSFRISSSTKIKETFFTKVRKRVLSYFY